MKVRTASCIFAVAMFAGLAHASTADLDPALKLCIKITYYGPYHFQTRQGCAAYLAKLMGSDRFGTDPAEPFCFPWRALTPDEIDLVFRRYSAANPKASTEEARRMAVFVWFKASRCGEINTQD